MRQLDREDLIVPATRYYMGRQSIAVTAHCQALSAAWPELSRGTQETIRRDLEEAFRRDDAMRADEKCSPSYYPLGCDIDREAWDLVRAAWRSPADVRAQQMADFANETKGVAR